MKKVYTIDETKMSFLRQASNEVPKSRSWGDDAPKQKQNLLMIFSFSKFLTQCLYQVQSMLVG